MWKKMGNVQPGNCCSARSHLSKDEEPFQPFYDKHLAVPNADPAAPPRKSSFCEAYINRHHSADKPHTITHSRSHSELSSLAPPDSLKHIQQPSKDLFSLMRSQDLVKRKPSLELQKAAVPDNTLALLKQQLKTYRDKWRDARQKLLTLKKKQVQLKTHVNNQLDKWKQAVQQAVGELANHAAVRREGVVVGALQAAKEFRGEQEKWQRERQGILERFNTRLDRLI